MNAFRIFTTAAGFFLVAISTGGAQTSNEKAKRYHDALLSRPDSETLFGRFFDSWLDSGSIAELETYLKSRAKPEDAARDWMVLATFYLRQGNDEEAIPRLEKIVSLESADALLKVDALRELGKLFGRELEFEKALLHFEKSSELLGKLDQPDSKRSDEILKLRGQFLIRSGRVEQGLAIWKTILEAQPEDHLLAEDVVELLADEGLFDEAIEQQKSLIEGAKDAYQTVLRRIQLGRLFRRAERRDEAVAAWREALPATGHGSWIEREVISLIEGAYRRQDDLRGLRKTMDEMVAAEPKRISLRVAQASLLAQLREDKNALEVWEEILKLTPGDHDLQLQFIRTLAQLDRPADAAERMKKLIELQKDEPELLFELAQLHEAAGQFEEAGKSFEAFLNQSDQSEYSYLRVARQLHRLKLTERAEAVFQKLVEEFPESAGAQESFAIFLYETERKGRAIDLWKSLGKTGDKSQLLRSARQLAERFETQDAFDLLKSRFDDFQRDTAFLADLCQLSLTLEKAAEAFPWAVQRVDLANTTDELLPAIDLAVKVAARTNDLSGQLNQLALSNTNRHCLAAAMRVQTAERERAESDLKDLIATLQPEEKLFPLVTLARIHKQNQSWENAAKTMEQVIDLPGGRRSSHIQELVSLFENAANSTAALHWAREWKKIAPGSSLPWLKESDMLSRQGKVSESLEVLQDAGRRFEKASEIQVRLARAYAGAGYPAEAERTMWKLYESATDDWGRRGWIDEMVQLAQENGRLELLIEKFEARQKNNSQALSPILALAEVYRLANRADDYREALLTAGRIDPNDLQLVHRIATLDEQQGRFDEAIQALEKIRKKDNSNRTSERLARIHLSLGNISKALGLISELPSGKKASAEQLEKMAQIIATIGEWETMAKFLAPRLAEHPDNHSIRYLRAIALAESGQTAAATDAFAELLNFPVTAPPQPPVIVANNNVYYFQGSFGFPVLNIPKAVTEIQEWVNAFNAARQYRAYAAKDGQVYSLVANTNQGQNPTPITIPNTQKALQAYAAAHLCELLDSEKINARLLAGGISQRMIDLVRTSREISELQGTHPATYINLRLPQSSEKRDDLEPYRKAIRELMDRYPEDAELHSYWALTWMISYAETELTERAISLIRDKFGADLASNFAFQAASGNNPGRFYSFPNGTQPAYKPSAPFTAMAIELVSELDEVPDHIANQVALFMNNVQRARIQAEKEKDDQPVLSEETWEGLHEILARWELKPSDEKNPWGNIHVFKNVLSVLANDGLTDEWIARVKSEVKRYEDLNLDNPDLSPPIASSSIQNNGLVFFGRGYSSYSHQLHTQLPHIPRRLPAFSPAVLHLLRVEQDPQPYNRWSSIGHGGFSTGWNLEKYPSDLSEKIDAFSDLPLVQTLVAHAIKDDDAFSKLTEELWEKRATISDPATLLLLAHQKHDSDKKAEAIELFEKVRYTPLDHQTAKKIDLAIVSVASKDRENLKLQGVKAAVRLRSSPVLDPLTEWQPVGEALKLWGETEKAKMPPRRLAAAAGTAPQNMMQYRRSAFQPMALQLASISSSQARISRLIDSGESDAAARVAARILPLLSGQVLNMYGENYRRQFQELRQTINSSPGLTKKIVENARPAPDARRLDHVRFAALCDVLENFEPAISAYRVALKDSPDDSVLRLRLLHLLARSAPGDAVIELKKLTENGKPTPFGKQALTAVINANMTLSRRLDVTETLMEMIEPPREMPYDQNDFQWVSALISRLTNSHNDEKLKMPGIFDQQINDNNYRPNAGAARQEYDRLAKKRIDIFIELCERTIEIPHLSSNAFSNLVKLKGVEDIFATNDDIGIKLPSPAFISETRLLELCRKTLLQIPNDPFAFWQYCTAPERKFSNGKLVWKDPENPAPQWTATGPVPWLVEYAARTNQQGMIGETTLLLREKRNDSAPPEKLFNAIASLEKLYFCEPEKFNEAIDEFDAESSRANPSNRYQYKWDFVQRAMAYRPEVAETINPDKLILARLKQGPDDSMLKFSVFRTRQIAIEDGRDAAKAFIEKIATAMVGSGKSRKSTIERLLPNRYSGYAEGSEAHTFQLFLSYLTQLIDKPETCFLAAEISRDLGLSSKSEFGVSWGIFRGNTTYTDPEQFRTLITNSGLLADFDEYEVLPKEDFYQFEHRAKNSLVASILFEFRDDYRSKELREKLLPIIDGDTFGSKLLRAQLTENPDQSVLDVFDEHVVALQKLPMEKREQLALLATDLISTKGISQPISEDNIGTLRWLGLESGAGAVGKLEKLLAAKTILETGLEPDYLLNGAKQQIVEAMIFDWQRSYLAFENVALLGDAGVKSRAIRPVSGSTFSASLLRSILNDCDPVRGFAFMNEAMHSKKLPAVYFDSPNFRRPIETAIRAAKNDSEKQDLLTKYVSQIKAETLEKFDSALAIPVFYELIRYTSSANSAPFKKWADGPEGTALFPKFGPDIKLAAELLETRGECLNSNKIAKDRIAEILKSDTLNPGLRLMIAQLIGSWDDRIPEELAMLSAENLATAWENTNLVPNNAQREILDCITHHYNRTTPEKWSKKWNEIDERLGSAFHTQYVVNSSNGNDDFILRQVLHTNLRSGNTDRANELLGKFESQIRSLGPFFVEMVRHGQFEVAGRLLRTNLEKAVAGASNGIRFDPQLAENVEPFLESLGDTQPWLKWFARLTLVDLYDPDSGLRSENWPDRATRIGEMAKSFDRSIFPREETIYLILNQMVGSAEREELFADAIIELTKGNSLRDIAQKPNTNNYRPSRVYTAALRLEIMKGNPTRAISAFKLFVQLSEDQKNAVDDDLWEFPSLTSQRYLSDKKVAHCLVDLWKEAAKRKPYNAGSSNSKYDLSYILGAHIYSNRTAELDSFFSSLPQNTRAVFKKLMVDETDRIFEYVDRNFYSLADGERQRISKDARNLKIPSLGVENLASTRITKFLNAKTASETGIANHRWEASINDFLNGAPNLVERRRIYDHAVHLVRQEQEGPNGWGNAHWNGWAYSSEQLRDYCEHSARGTWDGMALITDVLWNAPPKDLSYTWHDTYRMKPGFKAMWKAATANSPPADALKKILTDLRKSLREHDEKKWGSTAVFFPQFYEFHAAIESPSAIAAAIEAADQLVAKDDDQLAREFAAAGRFWIFSQKNVPPAVKKVPDIEQWQAHLENAINSEKTSPAIKMTLCRHGLNRSRGKEIGDLRNQFTKTAAELLKREVPVNGWALAVILREFNTLPMTPEWKETAKDFKEGWRRKNRNNSLPTKKGIGFHPVVDAALAMLQTELLLGDDTAAKKVLNQFSDKTKNDPRALALLVAHGKYDLAREWLKNRDLAGHHPNSYGTTASSLDVRYDEKLHAASKPFFDSLESDEDRFFAGYNLVTAPDLRPEDRLNPEIVPPRMKRMVEVAKQFKDIEFSSAETRNRALYLLSHEWQLAAIVLPALEKKFSAAATESIPPLKNRTIMDKELMALVGYAVGQVSKNDPKPFVELVTRLGNCALKKTDYYRHWCLNECAFQLQKLIDNRYFIANQEQLTAMRTATDALIKVIENKSTYSSYGNLLRSQILLSGSQEKAAPVSEWRNDLTAKQQSDLQSILKSNRTDAVAQLIRLLKPQAAKPASEEFRMKTVLVLFSDPWFQNSWSEAKFADILKPIYQKKILTKAQLVAHRDELIKVWPRGKKMEAELDSILGQN